VGTCGTLGADLRREAGAGSHETRASPGAALSRVVGTEATMTCGVRGTTLSREVGTGAVVTRGAPGSTLRDPEAALSREVGTRAVMTHDAPGVVLCREAGAAPGAVSGDFFLVASYCPTQHSRVIKKKINVLTAVAALTHSPSLWFLLRLLQAMSQCCDVRCSSTAPTIMTGFLACVCTCVDFVFEIFSRASFPAHRLLRLLLSL
jgi:hypothetical protein